MVCSTSMNGVKLAVVVRGGVKIDSLATGNNCFELRVDNQAAQF